MTQRLVSVGDDFNLPAAVNVVDENLPPRLADTALSATYATASAVAGKLDATAAATAYAPKSVETTKLDKTEAAATYATPSQVPPLVTQALASDSAPAAAAAAAVSDAVAGMDLVEVIDTYEPGFVFVDASDKKTALELDEAGNPSKRFASEMGKAGGFLGSSEVYDPGFSFTDADGKLLPELQFGVDGRFTDSAASNLRDRLNQRDPLKVARQIRKLDTATGALLDTAANNSLKYLLNTYIPTKFPGTGAIDGVLGGTSEQFIRQPATAAFSLAAAIFTGTYNATVTGVSVADAKAATLRLIAGVAKNHKATTSGGWGGIWQADMWAQAAAGAAWMIWADVDATTRGHVQAMMAQEAERFRTVAPLYWTRYDGVQITPGDSKSEEMAWTAGALATAPLVAPADPNATGWASAALQYFLSASTAPNDVLTGTTVQGFDMSVLFDGWNINQNGTVINHDRLHPDYMTAIAAGNWAGGMMLAYAGQRIPAAAVHNAELIYRALSVVQFNGMTIYTPGSAAIHFPQGNDWGTNRMADKAMVDVLAHCLGLDSRCSTPAATWAKLHLQHMVDQQARGTTGQYYQAANEDIYEGREQWVAHNLSLAVLANKLPTTTRYNYTKPGA